MKACEKCGEQKRRSEMGYNKICLECIEKEQNEYFQKLSKEELISMYRSRRKESSSIDMIITLGVLGVVISYLFLQYVLYPDIFIDLGFFEIASVVLKQMFTALGFCFVAAIASVLCYIFYIAVKLKCSPKIPKPIIAISLVVLAFFIYVLSLAA